MISAPGEKTVDQCLAAQVEEIEVLCSIYGDEWKTENEADRSYSIEIKEGDLSATLYVTLPETYPNETPPTYTLLAPDMTGERKTRLARHLDEVYLQNIGQPVLFQWIDKIKEYLSSLVDNENVEDEQNLGVKSEVVTCSDESSANSIEIIHGEQITEKKSTFQGHASVVFSVNEVKQVLKELKKNRKIAKATHNIYAYRIQLSDESHVQDCDDDGETNAGGRLLHLLQILDVSNVLVVVSRWYGGILLGPARFQHINNAARLVLEQAGLLEKNKKKCKNS